MGVFWCALSIPHPGPVEAGVVIGRLVIVCRVGLEDFGKEVGNRSEHVRVVRRVVGSRIVMSSGRK